MSSQRQAAKLAPELVKNVTNLARTLVAPPRNAQDFRLTFSAAVPPDAVSKLLRHPMVNLCTMIVPIAIKGVVR